jgi:hypothetical protein
LIRKYIPWAKYQSAYDEREELKNRRKEIKSRVLLMQKELEPILSLRQYEKI